MSILLLTGFLGIFSAANAQEENKTVGSEIKKGAKATGGAIKKGGTAVGKGASAVGNKTAELASKGKAGVVDKVYDDMEGPDGQKIISTQNPGIILLIKKAEDTMLPNQL